MKQIQSLIVALFVSIVAMAQLPQAINYQAVARNNAGLALANQTIKVRLSIMRGITSLYSETRSVNTNLLGLFNIQIGSAGALSTTGDFGTINWFINTPSATSLKVELDISNTNVFTDMGTQALATVPYAFSAATAIETINLAGRYIDPVTVPATGDLLQWNGSAWTPWKPIPAITAGSWGGTIGTIPAGGGGADWVFAGPTATITVNGKQQILANATGVFSPLNASTVPVSFSICWSLVAVASPINSFQNTVYPDATILTPPTKTSLSTTGLITLPAGTYKIGFGIKNKSTNSNPLTANDYVVGTYMIIN